MGILEERLWSAAGKRAPGRQIKHVVRGLRYTAVVLENGDAGLAFSFARRIAPGERAVPLLDPLPCPAEYLLELADSRHPSERALAVATANALLGVEGEMVADTPEVRTGETLLMVGNIAPLARYLRRCGAELKIVDDAEADALPPEDAEPLAAEVDRLILSASAVVNGTWEPLIDAARESWVVGPSAPMNAALYGGTSVRWVLGRVVTSPHRLLHLVAAGGGTRDLSSCAEKCLLSVGGTVDTVP
ncbi:MAG: DUF364 domain-containing protein [Synergistales bacterium]|nr:DUF364 domain-containing protein [Synergistales bacterium]